MADVTLTCCGCGRRLARFMTYRERRSWVVGVSWSFKTPHCGDPLGQRWYIRLELGSWKAVFGWE